MDLTSWNRTTNALGLIAICLCLCGGVAAWRLWFTPRISAANRALLHLEAKGCTINPLTESSFEVTGGASVLADSAVVPILAAIGGVTSLRIDGSDGGNVNRAFANVVAANLALNTLEISATVPSPSGWDELRQLTSLASIRIEGAVISTEAVAASGRIQSLESVCFINCTISRKAIARTANMHLVELSLESSTLTGTSDDAVGLCPTVTYLSLANATFTDEDMGWLETLDGLERLDLANTMITDSTAGRLGILKHLRNLSLAGCTVSDVSVAGLIRTLELERLYLDRTNISDDALEAIGNIQALKSLSVASTSVTDAGVAQLSRLARLEDLDLSYTQVSGACLRYCTAMRSLSTLIVVGVPVADAELQAFRQGHVKCEVIR